MAEGGRHITLAYIKSHTILGLEPLDYLEDDHRREFLRLVIRGKRTSFSMNSLDSRGVRRTAGFFCFFFGVNDGGGGCQRQDVRKKSRPFSAFDSAAASRARLFAVRESGFLASSSVPCAILSLYAVEQGCESVEGFFLRGDFRYIAEVRT